MKKTKMMKAKVLSMMAAMLLLSGNLVAQYDGSRYGLQPWFGESQGMLNRNGSANTVQFGSTPNRDEVTEFTLGGILFNENPTEAPLGSGLIVLVAAGAGYALLKKKEEEK